MAGHLISDLVIFLDVSEGWLLETNAFKIMALPKGETGGSDIKPTCLKLRLSGRAHVKIVCVLIWCSLLTLTQSTLAEVVKALVASSLSAPAIVLQSLLCGLHNVSQIYCVRSQQ